MVNRPMQERIISAVVVVPTIGLAVTALVVAFFCRRLVDEALLGDADLPSLPPLLYSVLGYSLVCSIVIVVRGLRFTQRVAGPAYRLAKSLERARNGDLWFRVTLRDGDYLGEVADELNQLLDVLQAKRTSGGDKGPDCPEVPAQESMPAGEVHELVGAGPTRDSA